MRKGWMWKKYLHIPAKLLKRKIQYIKKHSRKNYILHENDYLMMENNMVNLFGDNLKMQFPTNYQTAYFWIFYTFIQNNGQFDESINISHHPLWKMEDSTCHLES